MINVIKEIMNDCAYENVVQTEVVYGKMKYSLNIFQHNKIESYL